MSSWRNSLVSRPPGCHLLYRRGRSGGGSSSNYRLSVGSHICQPVRRLDRLQVQARRRGWMIPGATDRPSRLGRQRQSAYPPSKEKEMQIEIEYCLRRAKPGVLTARCATCHVHLALVKSASKTRLCAARGRMAAWCARRHGMPPGWYVKTH